jgi:hypothetical protein
MMLISLDRREEANQQGCRHTLSWNTAGEQQVGENNHHAHTSQT